MNTEDAAPEPSYVNGEPGRGAGRWRRLWRDLLGRTDDVFVDLLTRQVTIAVSAARTLVDAQREGRPPDEVRADIVDLEHRGDRVRTEVLTELARVLTTPIDGEDLYRLSGSIDDVLDNLRDFAIEADVYRVEPGERFVGPLAALAQGLEELASAISTLADDVQEATGAARAAKKANDARDAFHQEMGELLTGDAVTMQTLRDRELLRRLDVAGLRLASAADALISGALKRG
jgi:uncharacterized protein Yka (UPF0111/DUF47 family)